MWTKIWLNIATVSQYLLSFQSLFNETTKNIQYNKTGTNIQYKKCDGCKQNPHLDNLAYQEYKLVFAFFFIDSNLFIYSLDSAWHEPLSLIVPKYTRNSKHLKHLGFVSCIAYGRNLFIGFGFLFRYFWIWVYLYFLISIFLCIWF